MPEDCISPPKFKKKKIYNFCVRHTNKSIFLFCFHGDVLMNREYRVCILEKYNLSCSLADVYRFKTKTII